MIEHPALIAEILSASTSDYDRGSKRAAYLELPALREYLMVDPDTRGVELYRRNPDDTWLLIDFTARDSIRLESIDASVSGATLFEGL